METYHLIRVNKAWILKYEGAKRALVNFGNREYGNNFEDVLSATMTYAEDMKFLYVHDDSGRVVAKFTRSFISLWEEGR